MIWVLGLGRSICIRAIVWEAICVYAAFYLAYADMRLTL